MIKQLGGKLMKKISKSLSLILVMMLLVTFLTACGDSDTNSSDNGKQGSGNELILATQTVGTAVYARAAAYGEVIKPVLPEGVNVEIQPISTGGAAAVLLLDENKAQLATANNVPAKKLFDGTYEEGRDAIKSVCSILGGTDYTYLTIMFTDDFVKDTGYTTIEEVIENKHPVRIVTKQPGSFGKTGADDLLDVLGTSFEEIKSWGAEAFHIDPNQMTDMLKEGKADISIDVVSLGQPAFTELTMTTKMHVIELKEETRAMLNDYGYANKVMPANSWTGQEKDIQTVVGCETLIARADVSEDVIYEITKAICENKDILVEQVPAMEAFEPEQAADNLLNGLPLHPGAQKYIEEKGWL